MTSRKAAIRGLLARRRHFAQRQYFACPCYHAYQYSPRRLQPAFTSEPLHFEILCHAARSSPAGATARRACIIYRVIATAAMIHDSAYFCRFHCLTIRANVNAGFMGFINRRIDVASCQYPLDANGGPLPLASMRAPPKQFSPPHRA